MDASLTQNKEKIDEEKFVLPNVESVVPGMSVTILQTVWRMINKFEC